MITPISASSVLKEVDPKTATGVQCALQSIGEFFKEFEANRPGVDSFLLTVLSKEDNSLIPYGVVPLQVCSDRIEGELFKNDKTLVSLGAISIETASVVDWRLAYGFRLVGGYTMLAIAEGLEPALWRSICKSFPFFIELDGDCDKEVFHVFQNVLFENGERLFALVDSSRIDVHRTYVMPFRDSGSIAFFDTTLCEYVAAYGTPEMLRHIVARYVTSIGHLPNMLVAAICSGNHVNSVTIIDLLEDVTFRDEFGNTMLHLAAKHELTMVCVALIKKGIPVNAIDSRGASALFNSPSVSVAQKLVECGGRTDLVNDSGYSPYSFHLERGNFEVAKFLQPLTPPGLLGDRSGDIRQSQATSDRAIVLYMEEAAPSILPQYQRLVSRDYGSVWPTKRLT